MADGKIPGVRNVSKKEARELSKLPWVADDAVLSTFGSARVLSDGRVLLCHLADGSGTLYPSRAAAEEMNRQCAEARRQAIEQRAAGYPDPCFKLLPPIDDFIRDVDMHATSLGKTIKVAAEALDRSVASLDAVDKALKRIPWAKRPVPEILTPLVAYVGEVMRRASGGRWSKGPMTQKQEVPVYDSDELAAWVLSKGGSMVSGGRYLDEKVSGSSAAATVEAAKKAMEAVQQNEGGGSRAAMLEAAMEAVKAIGVREPAPIRFETIEEPSRHENEPMITARNGQVLRPFALLFIPMIEPSKRLPLRIAVEGDLWMNGYRPAPKPAA